MAINHHIQTIMDGEAIIDLQYDTRHRLLEVRLSKTHTSVMAVLSTNETAKLLRWIKDQVRE